MLGVFAEFERSIIQERVRAGLARAKSEGKTLGRPRVGNRHQDHAGERNRYDKGREDAWSRCGHRSPHLPSKRGDNAPQSVSYFTFGRRKICKPYLTEAGR